MTAGRTAVLAFLTIVGCDGSKSLDCAESLASYCSTHGCATSIDPQHVLSSFCDNQTAIDKFGVTGPCPSNGEIVVDVRKSDTEYDHFYYGATGQLEAVIEDDVDGGVTTFTCIAGPNSYVVPHTCLSDDIGYGCVRDAGAE